jgi:hypothetical protein
MPQIRTIFGYDDSPDFVAIAFVIATTLITTIEVRWNYFCSTSSGSISESFGFFSHKVVTSDPKFGPSGGSGQGFRTGWHLLMRSRWFTHCVVDVFID